MKLLDLGRYKPIALGFFGFTLLIGLVLGFNMYMSNLFSTDLSGIKYLAQQQIQPAVIVANSHAMAARLKTREPIGESFNSLRTAVTSIDQTLSSLANDGSITDAQNRTYRFTSMRSEPAASTLRNALQHWTSYKAKLDTVQRLVGDPYQTTADGVVTLNARGERLVQALAELGPIETAAQSELTSAFKTVVDQLEANGKTRVNLLRSAQITAIIVALIGFLGILSYLGSTLRSEDQHSGETRKETTDILGTVNEGLFLLDREQRIGSERSKALATIFRRDDFEGMRFEDLLRNIVPEKTLKTAEEYVELLWGERVNEKLVKTINPLNEVEVNFDNPAGGFDTHYLEFDFNRVKSGGQLSHLLVTVIDVTKRVMLAHELQESQEKSQAQLDLLLRILHVDPASLTNFLSDTETSLKMVNTILREPAREETMFRIKIDNIYRQIHAVKGEASALGLKTVEQRAHAFEDTLTDIKGRAAISGNDFLPLVVKLDDLFNHLTQVREMLGRLVDLHHAIAKRGVSVGSNAHENIDVGSEEVNELLTSKHSDDPREGTSALEALMSGNILQNTLNKLAQKVADNCTKQVELECTGLDTVPVMYRRAVKDISIQLVRNAVAHGIETPAERRLSNKPEFGQLSIDFIDHGDQGIELVVQDDGIGLQLDRIKQVAIERGLISTGQAALLDHRQTMALIFRPGFSTSETVTSDAGRGAGMDLVRSTVAELHGRVGMSTSKGRYTRFKIWLPAPSTVVAA
jgi:HPt (histidine-containing phosphotransfer) domain-containing protein